MTAQEAGQQIIKVEYSRDDGNVVTLMAGKVIGHIKFGLVCYHRYKAAGNEQRHRNTACPCPVDTVLIDHLRKVGVKYFYAHDLDGRALWRAPVEVLAQAPVMEYSKRTTRRRHFLAADQWQHRGDVVEVKQQQYVRLISGDALLLSVPFLPESLSVVLRLPDAF